MMLLPLKIEWAVLCLALLAIGNTTAAHLKKGLDSEDHLTAKRLAHGFIPLISKAHHLKDDLSLQQALSAMAQAPGVAFVTLLDVDEKIIADSRLAQIGKRFEWPARTDTTYSYPLKEGLTRWATLVFSLSNTSTHKLWRKTVVRLFAWIALAGIWYGIRLRIEAGRLKILRRALADQTSLCDDGRRQNENLKHDLTTTMRQSRLWFKSVLEKIPEPIVLLDGRQRIMAYNSKARELLGLAQPESWENMSWQDVPWLQDQGAALERSLQQADIDVLIEDEKLAGTIRTEHPWTWVRPRPVLRACR